MGRISTFIFGIAVGAVLIVGGQHYHLVRSNDGFYLVPKTETTMTDAYVDIRQFGVGDWTNHPKLAAALMQNKKEHLLGDSATTSLRDGLESAYQNLTGERR